MVSAVRHAPIWAHILFWGIYTLFWHWVYSAGALFNLGSLGTSFLYTLAHMSIAYVNLEVLMPRFIRQGHYLFYLLSVSSLFVLTCAFHIGLLSLWFYVLFDTLDVREVMGDMLAGSIIGSNMVILLLSIAYQLIWQRQDDRRQREALKREKMEAELRFLRGQLDPHFLFNALNSIYVLISRDADSAREALAGFSELLRYQLYKANESEIALTEEFDYLHRYAELAGLRRGGDLEVRIELPDPPNGVRIAPLLLLPLVENAYKHTRAPAGFIHICARFSEGQFHFKVENSTTPTTTQVAKSHAVGGIGLANVRRRLELLYSDRHALTVGHEDNQFKVELMLSLN